MIHFPDLMGHLYTAIVTDTHLGLCPLSTYNLITDCNTDCIQQLLINPENEFPSLVFSFLSPAVTVDKRFISQGQGKS